MLKIILKMYFCYFPESLEILGDTRMGQWKINISYKRENYVFVCSKIIVGKINFAPSFLSLHPYIPDKYYKFVKDNFMKPLCLRLCLFIGLKKRLRPKMPLEISEGIGVGEVDPSLLNFRKMNKKLREFFFQEQLAPK